MTILKRHKDSSEGVQASDFFSEQVLNIVIYQDIPLYFFHWEAHWHPK